MKYLRPYGVIGAIALVALVIFAVAAPDATSAVPLIADYNTIVIASAALAGLDPAELKKAMEPVLQAHESFKKSVDEQIAELKKGVSDPVLIERLSKMEKTMDTGIETQIKLASQFASEKKEREELELKFNRMGITQGGDAGKRELEIKTHNILLAAHNGQRNQSFTPLDEKGYDGYKAAHNTYLRKGINALTADEHKTLSVGSDPDGGYFVTPDTGGRIVKKVYETSPMRQIANVQTISTDALEGIEDLGEAGAGYAGEHATSGDTTTPQVGKWRIPVFWLDTEPKTTQQLLDDAVVDIEAWLSAKVGDKLGRFENNEYVNGAAAKIRGVTSYPILADSGTGVAWGSIGYVASGASGDFVAASSFPADKIFDLIGCLKEGYLPNARFLTRRQVITKMRKLKDTTGQFLWQPSLVLGNPESFAGYPITRAEDMPALGSDSLSLAFGDFQQGYQIVDRQGIRVLRDNLTAKPYVKFYTTKRSGGGVLNFEAIKVMKFANS